MVHPSFGVYSQINALRTTFTCTCMIIVVYKIVKLLLVNYMRKNASGTIYLAFRGSGLGCIAGGS